VAARERRRRLQKKDGESKQYKRIKEMFGLTLLPLLLVLIIALVLLLVMHSYFEKEDEEED